MKKLNLPVLFFSAPFLALKFVALLFAALQLLSLPLFSVPAQAEVYKCISGDRTVFADSPCGENAEVIDVSASMQQTGTQFSNDEIDALGSQLGKKRRQQELERDIARIQREINDILDDYNLKKAHLERELAEHKQRKYYFNWKHHHYQRDKYYEKRRELKNEIKAADREFKADREKAYNKLSSLRRERDNIH